MANVIQIKRSVANATIPTLADGELGFTENGPQLEIGQSAANPNVVIPIGGVSYTAAEQTKLSGIEANATADQTGAEIKTAYEAIANTNAYTDAEKTKLAGLANVTVVDDLTTGGGTDALSADQGVALKALIDGMGDVHQAATIAARDALAAAGTADTNDVVFVTDDGDGKWARYQNLGTAATPNWAKIQDEDALNAGLGATNLGYTAAAGQGTVTNSSGSDAVIPVSAGANAGLVIPPTTASSFLMVNSAGNAYEQVVTIDGGSF